MSATFAPVFSKWRHGGWYVDNIRYLSGAVGCVSRNYPDRQWRIVCDTRSPVPTYRTRVDAARAEALLAAAAEPHCPTCGFPTDGPGVCGACTLSARQGV